MAGKLVVYGDVSLDVIVQSGNIPGPGQDAITECISLHPGGSAANCAVTAARLGVQVEFLGVTGSDATADFLVDDLRAANVGIQNLRRTPGRTAVVVDIVTPAQDPAFFSDRGAAVTQPFGEIPPRLLGPEDHLHLSGYCFQDALSAETAHALLHNAAAVGAHISLDPSYHFARHSRTQYANTLAKVDLVFPNQEEAGLMGGSTNPSAIARTIQDLGPAAVIVKLGSQGCYVASAEYQYYVKSFSVKNPIDTTGAGDAFCGGYLFAAMSGLEPSLAAKIGHAAANHVIRRLGGHAAAPTLAEMLDFLDENGEQILAERLSSFNPMR